MSDSCGFDAGDRRVRAHRKRAADSGCSDARRACFRIRTGLFAISTAIFAAAFGGGAAAQGPGPGPGPGPSNTLVPAATSNAHRSGQATVFDVGSQFLQWFNAMYSFRTAASPANNAQGGGAEPSAEQRYRAWFESYGLRSHTDA